MPSAYPSGYDTLPDPSANLSGPPLHSSIHNAVNDAIEAIQHELGLDPSGADATVAATLAALPSRYVSTTRMGCTLTRTTAQSMVSTVLTDISWTTEVVDTNGFIAVTGSNILIPAGCAGIYAITVRTVFDAAITGYTRITALTPYSFVIAASGQGSATAVVPLGVADTVTINVLNNSATANLTTARVEMYRIGM